MYSRVQTVGIGYFSHFKRSRVDVSLRSGDLTNRPVTGARDDWHVLAVWSTLNT